MSKTPNIVNKSIQLPAEQAKRLSKLAESHQISEDQIVKEALDLLFSLIEMRNSLSHRADLLFGSKPASGESLQDRSLYGLWADLGPTLSTEEIDEARKELWRNFPREDIA